MAKVKGGKFGVLHFNVEQGYSCCGHGVVYDLTIGATSQIDWGTRQRTILEAFETREEQLAHFYSNLFDTLRSKADDHFDGDWEDDEYPEFCYAFLSMTLIKKPDEQIPGLIDFLLDKGWKIDVEGMNPKTENIIVHMSYKL